MFSASEELKNDEILSELYDSKKIIFYEESFASFIKTAQEQGFTIPTIDKMTSTDSIIVGIGKEFKLFKKENSSFRNISKYASVVNEGLFIENQELLNDNQRYNRFKEFLAARTSIPMWSAYSQGYVFERTFFQILIKKIENLIGTSSQPIILHGQSSSGKSISLGYIAYVFSVVKEFKVPVIFIDGKKQKLEPKAIGAINDFCKEVEYLVKQTNDNTPTTLIIWDGNQLTDDEYFNLQKSLKEKGRRVLVLGTMYTSSALREDPFLGNNYLEAPIILDDNENERIVSHFGQFLKVEFINSVLTSLSHTNIEGMNFLSLLYRLLPSTHHNIKKGLKEEIAAQSDSIIKNFKPEKNNVETFGSIFSNIFSELYEQYDINPYQEEITIDEESLTVIEGIKLSVAAVKQFPTLRSIPFSIIVRIYGVEHVTNNLLDFLEKNDDFIRVEQDDDNESSLTIRTSEEAKLWLKDRVDADVEFTILNNIVKNINNSKKQIDFAIKLLDYMSPQSKIYKTRHFTNQQQFDLFLSLEKLRQKDAIVNSRLIVQESSFIREVIKNNKDNNIVICEDNSILNKEKSLIYLLNIERVIENRIELDKNSPDKYTYLNLLNEKIILNRYKIENESDIDKCVQYYNDAIEATTKSRSINPSNFYPVASMFHVTTTLLKKEKLGNEISNSVLIDILTLFDNVEIEAFESFKSEFKEQFLKDKIEITERLQKTDLQEQSIQRLRDFNPSAIHYLEVFKIIEWDLPFGVLNAENIEKSKNAFEYLNQPLVSKDIDNDSKCLYLKMKFWWQWKTGYRLYANEDNQVLPFDNTEWLYCLQMVNKLMDIENGNYSRPHLDYIRAVCLFHISAYRDEAFEIFDRMENEFSFNSQFIHNRLMNRYLASKDGKPIQWSGELVDNYQPNSDKEGEVYLRETNKKIKFKLSDFAKQKDYIFNKNDTLHFYIGFSFRNPFAIPTSVKLKIANGERGENG